MSLTTRKMRRGVRGESLEDWLQRQHVIDAYQRWYQKWENPYTWKTGYDADADIKAQAETLRRIEDETWNMNRAEGIKPNFDEAIKASQDGGVPLKRGNHGSRTDDQQRNNTR